MAGAAIWKRKWKIPICLQLTHPLWGNLGCHQPKKFTLLKFKTATAAIFRNKKTEFLNVTLQQMLKCHKIHHNTLGNEDTKVGVVERFNRMLKLEVYHNFTFKYMRQYLSTSCSIWSARTTRSTIIRSACCVWSISSSISSRRTATTMSRYTMSLPSNSSMNFNLDNCHGRVLFAIASHLTHL